MSARSLLKQLTQGIAKNSPSILTGIGLAGFTAAIALTAVITPKVVDKIKAERKKKEKLLSDEETEEDICEDNEDEDPDDLQEDDEENAKKSSKVKAALEKMGIVKDDPHKFSKWDAAKIIVTGYGPVIALYVMASICIITANKVNLDRLATAIVAGELSANAAKEYSGKVVEKFGDKVDQEIKDEIAKDQIRSNPVTNNVMYVTNGGQFPCYEPISKQYITSDSNTVEKAVLSINRELQNENWCSVAQYHEWLHMKPDPNDKTNYDDLGWYAWDQTQLVDWTKSYHPVSETDDTPCLVINIYPAPEYRYKKRH